jgi:ubiquinone/menaquinone biosynthesis C-methylase UbiE
MGIKQIMYRQLQKSQDKLLHQMLFDIDYANQMGGHDLHAQLLRWLDLEKHINILELGCGPGKYVGLLANVGFTVTGVDPLSFPTWGELKKRENIKLLPGVYAEKLPFDDDSFDAVVCLSALLYFENPNVGLLEMKRVLKPGGLLIVRTVNSLNFYTAFTGNKLDPASKQLYSPEELLEFVSSHGFNVQHVFTHGFWPPVLTNFWWYLQCVWLPHWLQSFLSHLTPDSRRINCTVIATKTLH